MYFQQLQHTAKRHRQEKDLAESVLKPGPNFALQCCIFEKKDASRQPFSAKECRQLVGPGPSQGGRPPGAEAPLGNSATGMASAGKLSYSHGQR